MVSRARKRLKQFAFVMDPLESLDLPWDTSLCLLRELNARGHQNFLFVLSSLSLEAGQVFGQGNLVKPLGNHHYDLKSISKTKLASFDAVFIRKDPPFDSNYLSLTYLLEPLVKKTLVINDPRGIRNANEKLSVLSFPKWSPPSLVSSNPDEILAFQKKIKSDLVIKPLYEKGGKGVFRLKKGQNNLLKKSVAKDNWVIAQKFIPSNDGDKRILIWRGKILGAFSRIPPKGDFRSNLSLGGKFVKCRITQREKNLVRSIAPFLLKEGLLFVGIDVRGGYLIEMNVTSPAGLVELDQLYGQKATRQLADSFTNSNHN